jgi:cytochrome oxidase Cu insertion factor (SCO1/SenC/PrrC family)
MRWWLALAAAVLGIGIGTAVAVLARSGSSPAAATSMAPDARWAARARAAPDFRLLSLRALRGRPVVLTFVDPACRTLCPLEARELGKVAGAAIVAVSVNPRADTRANFRKDARDWRLPSDWRWAVGPRAALARVRRAYRIAVEVQPGTHDVAHTEAAYLIDARGYERALFVYPFRAADVQRELQRIAAD